MVRTHKSKLMSNGWSMSALPLIADIRSAKRNVHFGPKGEHHSIKPITLVDQLRAKHRQEARRSIAKAFLNLLADKL